MAYCVMVSGPCRGNMCDFWARVKIRKSSTEDLAILMLDSVQKCGQDNGSSFDDAVQLFWKDFGVKDMVRVCDEEPDLCTKIKLAQDQVRSQLA
ncbi:MAG: hypothetical protein ACFE7R_09635 [Candidatus Hodarchaeota archaeon]